jgi:hypothetical protein
VAFIMADVASVVWRLASAVARPRAAPAAALAPLSHMLSMGFFFSHGFFIVGSLGFVDRFVNE